MDKAAPIDGDDPRAELVGDAAGAGHYDATIAELVRETRALAEEYQRLRTPTSTIKLDELAHLIVDSDPLAHDRRAVLAIGALCRRRTRELETALAADPMVAAHARTATYQGVVEAAQNVVADYEELADRPDSRRYDDVARRLHAFLLLPPDAGLPA